MDSDSTRISENPRTAEGEVAQAGPGERNPNAAEAVAKLRHVAEAVAAAGRRSCATPAAVCASWAQALRQALDQLDGSR